MKLHVQTVLAVLPVALNVTVLDADDLIVLNVPAEDLTWQITAEGVANVSTDAGYVTFLQQDGTFDFVPTNL